MRIDVSVDIPFPRPLVFATYRDHLVDLVPYLPNLRAISVTSRQDEGDIVKLLNRWKGGGDIPALVRKFLSEELLEWDDHATWFADQFRCEWRTVVPSFKEAVKAEGYNRFDDLGGTRTRLTILGDLSVDAKKIRGVPGLLAGTVGPAVEKFLMGAIRPNLVAVSKGVERYLNEHR